MNLRDAFGVPAKDLGESTIYFYSPHLRYARVPISDTELFFEVSAEKAVATAPYDVTVVPSAACASLSVASLVLLVDANVWTCSCGETIKQKKF